MPAIAPSILAADFARLGEQAHEAELGGADRIHVDVMDGHFVHNLSMGPAVVKALRPLTKLPLEVHLMVEEPARFVRAFRKAGADTLIVHHEVLTDAQHLIDEVRGLGARIGIAVNPGTPVGVLERYLADIDLALCMTVWPGFGGQAFLPESPGRIAALRQLIDRVNPKCELEVDGGVDLATAPACAKAGANVFVAGTSIFGSRHGPRAATAELVATVQSATPA
jgi:ribulose-phosphate 3-epimerase